jgi:aspartyl-tRNA synthetase
MMAFSKTHDIADISADMAGERVVLGGWIEDLRKMGKMSFITLRDVSGISQVIAKGRTNEEIGEINRQSTILVSGTVQETRARDYSFEINADAVEVLGRAVHPLPVDPIGRLESNIDTRLNHRALDMRNQKTASIFKIRHHVLQSLRRTLSQKRFLEITTPKIIGSASEGGANLFSLEYFGRTAYLAQSPQLYKEQMTLGLERVFEISNFYRAENSHTGRHLTEFTSVDIEAAFMDYGGVMDVLEDLVTSVYGSVSQDCQAEQDAVGHPVEVPASPFERITYNRCVEELRGEDQKVEFGDDLLDSHLRIIGQKHPGFFFLTDWPIKLKPFYIMEKDEDATLSRSFDLQHGYLELSSGGTRLHDPEVLKARLKEQGLDPAQFADHLKAFDWGMPPHSGWGMGLDRLMATIIGVDNVREVVLYPRDPDRLRP